MRFHDVTAVVVKVTTAGTTVTGVLAVCRTSNVPEDRDSDCHINSGGSIPSTNIHGVCPSRLDYTLLYMITKQS